MADEDREKASQQMNQNHLQMTPNWAGSLLSPYTALLAEEFFIMNTELLLLLPLLNGA